jgi:aminoglycoside phosphotransferase (APT) family kinase protein
MSTAKLHGNEISTDTNLVHRLMVSQFPRWKELSVQRVTSQGTDNVLYKPGRDMMVRMPRVEWAVEQVSKEQR